MDLAVFYRPEGVWASVTQATSFYLYDTSVLGTLKPVSSRKEMSRRARLWTVLRVSSISSSWIYVSNMPCASHMTGKSNSGCCSLCQEPLVLWNTYAHEAMAFVGRQELELCGWRTVRH